MDAYNHLLEKCAICCIIPQRYVLAIMASLAILNSYTMRVCLSMAITQMVPKSNKTFNSSEVCSSEEKFEPEEELEGTYPWDENIQGLVLGSFYWGYIITHLPGGLLAESFGAKHVIGLGLFINAILTFCFPWAITSTDGNWIVAVVMRVIMGCGQGVLYPAVTALLAQWIPDKEKGGVSSLTFAGALMGTVVSNSISGVLMQHFEGWAVVFYFFGCGGLLWNVFWQLLCYSYPRTSPCLKVKEQEFLKEELSLHLHKKKPITPWKHILLSVPIWGLIAGQFGHDWGWFTMVTDLPKYMDAVLRFRIEENGLWSSLPYLLMYGSTIGSGYLADYFIRRKLLSVAMTRRIFATIGTMGPAIFLILASYVGCNKMAAVACFTLSLVLMGFYFPGMKVNALDLSPNFAGTIMALQNGFGVFAGMAAPPVVGFLAPEQTMKQWRLVFWVCFGIFAVTNVLFVVFMSAKVQPWNNLDRQEVTGEEET